MTKSLLDPPYDGYAVWHTHAFPPEGKSFPEHGEDEYMVNMRFDAVQDKQGRIFVWSVGEQEPICVCRDRETAIRIAVLLCRSAARGDWIAR